MKQISFLLLFLVFFSKAQFTSPGNGTSYTLSSLSTASPTPLVNNGSSYTMTSDITISAGDTLLMDENTTLVMNSGVKLTVAGSYNTTATALIIKSPDTSTFFNGIQFESGSTVIMKNTTVEYGGGIRVFTGNFLMDNCIVRYFNSGLLTGSALQLSSGSPIIKNSQFLENSNPAIASGVTNTVSATIENNYFYGNNTTNNNRPQINMSRSGADSIKIINNTVIGNRNLTMVGGISASNLSNGIHRVKIVGNTVKDNRYGITVIANGATGIIKQNVLELNDTEINPMNGGSGIALYGTSSELMVTQNQIRNNLWGITILSNGSANLGSDITGSENIGQNIFYNNGNGGNIYAFYNNTPNPIQAKFNCWREGEQSTGAMVEAVIGHHVDDPSLGLVTFSPYICAASLGTNTTQIQKTTSLYPNPNDGNFFLEVEDVGNILVSDVSGQLIHSQVVKKGKNKISIKARTGLYFLTFLSKGDKANFKFIVK